MPTLLEIGVNTPPTEKVFKMTPPDASKKSPPRTIKVENNAAPSPAVSEMTMDIALNKRKAKNKSDDNSGYLGDSEKKLSRKRASKQRQSSIFESIGMEAPASASQKTPPAKATTTPKSSSKKRKTTSAPVPKLNAKPICIHLAVEGKETKKLKIDCHALKKEFDDILDAPIVLKEKRALPKDPLCRFLRGFGRYIS